VAWVDVLVICLQGRIIEGLGSSLQEEEEVGHHLWFLVFGVFSVFFNLVAVLCSPLHYLCQMPICQFDDIVSLD